jgi:hypothetical protein
MSQEDDYTGETSPESNPYGVSASHADMINTENIKSGSDASTEHTKPFQLEHPVEEVEDLYGSEYGQYLLREAQVDNGVEPDDRSQEAERRVEQAFDLRVIETTKRVLQLPVTDATRGGFPMEDSAVLALVLQRVRAVPAEDFSSHLEEVPKVKEKLGVDDNLDETTITAWEQELTETDEEAVQACATRVLYAVYRSGQAFPQQVWDATVAAPDTRLLTNEEKERLDDGKMPDSVTREALRNWAREFLETCVQGEFSFARDETQTEYPVMSIVGVFAHAALQSRTVTEACKTCPWSVDPELVPDRTTVMEPINDLNIDAIAELFQRVNHRFLEFADEYTILHGSKQLAYDPTSIPYYAESQDDRWPKGYGTPKKGNVESADFDQQVEFALAAVTEGDVRFALGMYPIKKEYGDDERERESIGYADIVSRLMRPTRLETPVSVDLVVMDRGLNGADLIHRCRDSLGDNWIMLGKQQGELEDLVEETPQNEPRFVRIKEHFGDLSNKPNAFIVPVPDGQTCATDSQWLFLTDLPRKEFLKETADGEQKLAPEKVISRYQNRARIEKTLQQLKHDFNIPVRENTHTCIKYFCLNMSMLFYNLHNLIINSISPTFGLPLGKTRGASNGQVLSAIREVAFELAAEQKH